MGIVESNGGTTPLSSTLDLPTISHYIAPVPQVNSLGSFNIAPASAGIKAPMGGLFLLLKSSHICYFRVRLIKPGESLRLTSIVTHCTPSFELIYSINLRLVSIFQIQITSHSSPFQHQNNMRMPGYIRVYRYRITKIVLLSVEEIEMISPQLLHSLRVHPPVRVRRLLNEEHWGEVVEIPIARNLHEACFLTLFEGMHPVRRVLGVVDGRPRVACAEPVR